MTMSKHVRPMQPISMAHLRSKVEFAEAVEVTGKLGLHHLMGLQCHYNVTLLKQFYATLVINGDEARTMKWMPGNVYCTATFREFGELLGYDFKDIHRPSGIRLHGPERISKDRLASLYGSKGDTRENHGLLPLYDLLVRIFREHIAPSGSNNDSLWSSCGSSIVYS